MWGGGGGGGGGGNPTLKCISNFKGHVSALVGTRL